LTENIFFPLKFKNLAPCTINLIGPTPSGINIVKVAGYIREYEWINYEMFSCLCTTLQVLWWRRNFSVHCPNTLS
jgi:hypothetical protein